VLFVMAIALVFPSCDGSDARSDLEQAISERLAGFIQDEQLPYVVSQEPTFIETTEEQAVGTGLPAGTWFDIGFEFATRRPYPNPPEGFELPRSPTDLYAKAIRPYFDDMGFVVMYRLPWFDEGSIVGTYNIYPEDMRMYLDGRMSLEQFCKEITIDGSPPALYPCE
jgi:hypothetical protein